MTMRAPLALWTLHRLVRRGDGTSGVALGLLVGAQTLSSLYYGIYLSLYLAPVFAMLLLLSGARPLVTPLRQVASAAAVALTVTAPLEAPYVATRDHIGERTRAESIAYSTRAIT